MIDSKRQKKKREREIGTIEIGREREREPAFHSH